MGRGSGVEVRDSSIRILFTVDGKRYRQTLKTDGKPVAPTPNNVKWAYKLAEEIRQRIRYGTFTMAEYFPDSVTTTSGEVETVGQRLETFMGLQIGKASSTLKGYRVAADWWKAQIGSKPLPALVHSDVLTALASEPDWTGKTRNNKVSVLRQALVLAIRDGVIRSNPLEGLEAFSHQTPEPDPFDRDEAEAIIECLTKHYHPQVGNYFGAKFFTGLRTSESIAQQWAWLDTRKNELAVSAAVVLGELKASTKTNQVRIIQLNSRAMDFYRDQKAHTFMKPEGWIFNDPKTGERWVDDWTPRRMYWEPALKRLGIRYRSPYQTRHTYATMLLMAGVTPAFAARQMGHSVEMFLRIYARWIDGGHNALEMGKLEGLLGTATVKQQRAG